MNQRFLLLTLLLALTLSACGGGAAAPTSAATAALPTLSLEPTPTPTATPVPSLGLGEEAVIGRSLVLWHTVNGPAQTALEAAVDRFNAENSWGIQVYPRAFDTPQALMAAMQAALEAAAGAPDVVVALPQEILAWDQAGAVLDLTPYWVDADWGLMAEARAAFYPALLAQDQVDGRLLGLPAQRSARGLFYNRSWAADLGFTAPPRTAEDFRAQVCAANQQFRLGDEDETNDGFGGWLVDGSPQTALGWLAAFGGGAGGAAGYDFTQPANEEALRYLKTLFDEACAWLPDPQAMLPPYYDPFYRRQALAISGSSSEIPTLQAYWERMNAADEWTLLPFPGPESPAYALDGSSYALLRSTPEQQLAAWLFLRWLMRPEQQLRWVQQTGYLPVRADLPQEALHPALQAVLNDLAAGTPGLGQPQRVSWRKGRAVLGDGFYILFYQNWPVDDVPALLETIQTTLESLEE